MKKEDKKTDEAVKRVLDVKKKKGTKAAQKQFFTEIQNILNG